MEITATHELGRCMMCDGSERHEVPAYANICDPCRGLAPRRDAVNALLFFLTPGRWPLVKTGRYTWDHVSEDEAMRLRAIDAERMREQDEARRLAIIAEGEARRAAVAA